MRLVVCFVAAVAVIGAAQLVSEEPSDEFQTEYGWIPASHCSSYDGLKDRLVSIVTVLVDCGISRERALDFVQWVVNENVFTVVDDPDTVCIPAESNTNIGTRLGEITREHIRALGWDKRRRNDSPQLEFDGNHKDDTVARKSCCQCNRDEHPLGKGKCKAGPCCPNACLSLNQLLGGSAEMVSSCCEESRTRCRHRRNNQNSGGQRGKRRPPTF
ncbi:unnamed protein product [Agarophyton chilense]